MKPFTLPRNLHEVLPEGIAVPANSETHVYDKPEDVHAETILVAPAPSTLLVLETFDIEEDDEPLEKVQIPEVDTPASGAIRSMAELAAAHAQMQEDLEGDPALETQPEPAAQAPALRASTRTSRSGTSTPAKANGKATNGNSNGGEAATRKLPARRGRKRTRDSGENDHGDSANIDEPAQAKRAKRAHGAAAPAVKSDRVLRSRRGKTEGQMQAEREQGEAFRRAVEE